MQDINVNDVGVFDLEDLVKIKSNIYKILQVTINNNPNIVFGPSTLYHSDIFEKYLLHKRIEFSKDKLCDGTFGPSIYGDNYKVIGGGMSIFTKNVLVLFDKSVGYDIVPNKDHLDALKSHYKHLDFMIK